MPRQIALTRGDGTVTVDDDMFDRVSQYKWSKSPSGFISCSALGQKSLFSFIAGRRPTPTYQMRFLNNDRRDFRRENIQWARPICSKCERPLDGGRTGGICNYCHTLQQIDHKYSNPDVFAKSARSDLYGHKVLTNPL